MIAASSLGCASAAGAAWGPSVGFGTGGHPLLAVSRSGAGALAFTQIDGSTELARSAAGGQFGAPQAVSLGGSGSPALQALALPNPAAVLLFQNDDGSIDARFQSSDGGPLGAPQQLVAPTEGDLSAGSGTLVTTTLGAVIAGTISDRGDAGAPILSSGAEQFGDVSRDLGFAQCGAGPGTARLVADDAGGAFAAAGFGCSKVSVYYRRLRGQHPRRRPRRRPLRERDRRLGCVRCRAVRLLDHGRARQRGRPPWSVPHPGHQLAPARRRCRGRCRPGDGRAPVVPRDRPGPARSAPRSAPATTASRGPGD